VSDPKDNEAACEDFMITVTDAHVLACAMEFFGMDSLTDTPSTKFFPDGSSELDSLQRRNVLLLAAEQLVEKYVDLAIPEQKPKKKKQKPKKKNAPPHDGIYEYAKDTLTLGLLLKEYIDTVRESDGDRIMCVWKFLLPLFRSTGRTNYSLEAFTLLAQYYYLLSPRMATQLAWSRTVNTHGRPGKNISCDLHLEHLNREVKNAFGGLSSNITEQSVKRIGKSIKGLSNVTRCFDNVNHIPTQSGYHTGKPKTKDVKMILEHLRKAEVFQFHNGRDHQTFPKFESNPCKAVNQEALIEWMDGHMKKLLSHVR
jgi:L1 cell adhesion molecule like protein